MTKKANIVLLSNVNTTQARILSLERANQRKSETEKFLLVELAGCPYCMDMSSALHDALKKERIHPTKVKIHIDTLRDTTDALSNLVGSIISFFPSFEADAARLILALRRHSPNARFWGTDGWGTLARFVKELPGAKTLRASWVSHYHPEIQTAENKEFVARFRSKYGTDPLDTSAMFFEAASIAKSLLSKKPTTAKETMTAFSRMGQYRGLTGHVLIKGNRVERDMPFLEMVNGQVRLIKLARARKEL
ncbi:MAG: ABC transporter substrate-binding protein [Calothrix sp. SM1_5_4]|nr:ABC transporter substrate-binding protein [Calothrix sp. SM1_5_4]